VAVVRLGTSTRTAAADAIVDQLDLGAGAATIQLRSGAIPATPQTAASGTLLGTVTLADPAAGAAASGVATITDPASVTGVAAGDIGYARFLDSNGVAIMDMDVTATGGGGAIQLATVTVSVGVTIDLGAITITVPQG
jgi:hypothetical protein